MSDEKTVVVHNRSQRVIHTSKGPLPIGGSLEVDAVEAKSLLDYPGIVDAAKLVPQATENINQLRSRVKALESDVENLRAENEQLKRDLEEAKDAQPDEDEPEKRNKKGKR